MTPVTRETAATNREEWLTAAVAALAPLYAAHDVTLPDVRVSVGWPGGRGKKSATIGQCWSTTTAADKVAQIFISPVLHEPVQVLATLAHELVHAVDDCASGHRGAFARLAKAIGLEGPMTATSAGPELAARLEGIAADLGDYPHARLTAAQAPKKQSTRMRKVECSRSGYVLRTTAKWLDSYGAPLCPCHKEPMIAS